MSGPRPLSSQPLYGDNHNVIMTLVDMKIIQKSLVLLLIFIPVVSCSSLSNSPEATSMDISLSSAPSLKSVSSPTKTKRPSSTPTANPPTETPTMTANPDPTWTALPTLARSKAREFVVDLMETNAGCSLPCWWGIVPGETNWQSAYHFFQAFATEIKNEFGESFFDTGDSFTHSEYYIHYEIPGIKRGGVTRLSIRDGIVTGIQTGPFTTIGNLQLNRVLSVYGKPDEVYMSSSPDTGPVTIPFRLFLHYANERVAILYEFEKSFEGEKVRACPEASAPWIRIGFDGGYWTEETIKEAILGPLSRQKLLSIDEATNYDIINFTKTFLDQNSCFESPSSLWEYD